MLLLCEAGVTDSEAAEATEAAFEVFYQERVNVRPFAGAADLLDALRKRYQLVSLTNGNADVERTPLKKRFHLNLNPQRVGVRKPDPLMFLTICEQFKVKPSEVLHIGDHYEEDVLAAKDVGFQALWISHRAERDTLWPERRAQVTEWLQTHKREPVAPFVDSIDALHHYLTSVLSLE